MRLRWLLAVALGGVLIVAMAPTTGVTQPPGRFGSFDPNAMFEERAKGRGYIVIDEIPDPQRRERYQQFAQQNGITDGRITREQYMSMVQGMMSRFSGRGGGGRPSGGAPMGGPPSAGPPPSSDSSGGDRGSDRDRGGWGNFNPEMIADYRFRQLDQNGDGLLNNDEIASDDTLRTERDKFDENMDAFIDSREFRNYIQARIQQHQAQNPGGWGGDSSSRPSEEAESKTKTYRAGSLPKEVPSWFAQLDTDRDAQVGLYEWRIARKLDEFTRYDLNNDGFLTVPEVLRAQGMTIVASSSGGTEVRGSGQNENGFNAGYSSDRGGDRNSGYNRGGDPRSNGGSDRPGPPWMGRGGDPRSNGSGDRPGPPGMSRGGDPRSNGSGDRPGPPGMSRGGDPRSNGGGSYRDRSGSNGGDGFRRRPG